MLGDEFRFLTPSLLPFECWNNDKGRGIEQRIEPILRTREFDLYTTLRRRSGLFLDSMRHQGGRSWVGWNHKCPQALPLF